MISDFQHRLLRRNHATGIPHRVLYIDTETKQDKQASYTYHSLKIAWTCSVRYSQSAAILNERWRYWTDDVSLWDYIDRLAVEKSTLTIFAHNAFFDLQASRFFHLLPKKGWMHDFFYEKGLTYILTIKKGDRRINVLSTTNYFSTKLKNIGEMMGVPKLEVDFDTVSDEDLSTYCKRDVEITKRAMEYYFALIIKHDLGQFSKTRAAQSFRSFRHKFMHHKIYIHDNDEVKELERRAYYGGRVECFEFGILKGGPFLTLDVNSMYPYVMKYLAVPHQLVEYKTNPSITDLSNRLESFACVADVTVKTDVPIYPIRKKHKIIFPIGEFSTSLCTPSLRYALDHNHITHVSSIASYQKAQLFTEYITYFYKLRQEYKRRNEKLMTTTVKLFLNSLYGKFGQKRIITEEREEQTGTGYERMLVYDSIRGVFLHEYKLFNKWIAEIGTEEHNKAFAAISAHVTDEARLVLWKIIEGIGIENVLYCDTDSIKIRKKDLSRITWPIDDYKLGALKIEKEDKQLELWGAKSYITETKRVIKGVPVTAKMLDKFHYEYYTWLKQASHLNLKEDQRFITRKTVKAVIPSYDKGIVSSTGRVFPFQFSLHSPLDEPPLEPFSYAP